MTRPRRHPVPRRAPVSAALGSGLLLAVAVLLPAAPAAAAGAVPSPGARLGLAPSNGNTAAVPQLTTSGPCPGATTHVYAQLFGGPLPDEGQLLRDTSAFGFSTEAAFSTESSRRLSDVFLAGGAAPVAGAYVVELVCTDATLSKLATFTAPVTFTSADAWTSPADAPQTTAATLAAGDGSAPTGIDLGGDDAAGAGQAGPGAAAAPGQPAPDAAAAPGADAPTSAGAPAGRAQEQESDSRIDPLAAPASGSTSSPVTLIGVALLGALVAAALLLGLPALRRRRPDVPLDDALDRQSVSSGGSRP